MIFASNTTALNNSTIPMAEGYDSSCGIGLALVESARNDMAMFRAMIQADYKEMAIYKESTEEVVQEGEIAALHEAVGGGIIKKVVELFKKLVAKIKSIFHNFAAKLRSLYMEDKNLVKKYSSEIGRKPNIEKLQVKWRKNKTNIDTVAFNLIESTTFDDTSAVRDYKDDAWERVKVYLGKNFSGCNDTGEYIKEFVNYYLEEEDTLSIKDIGGWRKIATFLSEYEAKIKKMESNITKSTSNIEKRIRELDKSVAGATKASLDPNTKTYEYSGHGKQGKRTIDYKDKFNVSTDKSSDAAVGRLNKMYQMAQAYQTATLATMEGNKLIANIDYKQHKAAFIKMVTASKKNLEESAVLCEAAAAVAEAEVVDKLLGDIDKNDIFDNNIASDNLFDGKVSTDPDFLTGGEPDQYTDNEFIGIRDGRTKDVDYVGTTESTFFGEMFY